MRSTGVSEKTVLPLRKIWHFFAFRCPRTTHRQQLYHHSPTKRNGRNRPNPLDKRMPLPPRSHQKGRAVLCVLVAGFAKWNGNPQNSFTSPVARESLYCFFNAPNDPHKNDQSQKVQGSDRNPNIKRRRVESCCVGCI